MLTRDPFQSQQVSAYGVAAALVFHGVVILGFTQLHPDVPVTPSPTLIAEVLTSLPEVPKPTPPTPPKTPIPVVPRPQPVVPQQPAVVTPPVLAAAATSPAPSPQTIAPPPPPVVAAPVTAPQPLPVSEPRFDADYLHNPTPEYPPLSRRMEEQGKVLLRVFVEPDGHPSQVKVKESSGFPRLDRAAENAVSRWKFVPAKQGKESVGAWVVVPIVFSLGA